MCSYIHTITTRYHVVEDKTLLVGKRSLIYIPEMFLENFFLAKKFLTYVMSID